MHSSELPQGDVAQIDRAIEFLEKFYSQYKNIEVTNYNEKKEIKAFTKSWWSTKKTVIDTINVTYRRGDIPIGLENVYDNIFIEVIGGGKNILLNNGLTFSYPKLIQEEAQENLKNEVSGRDYLKALVYVIDRLDEKKKMLSIINKS